MVGDGWARRAVVLPSLDLLRAMTGVNYAPLHFREDNQATIAVVRSGRNPTTRYLGRAHRVSVAGLCEMFKQPLVFLGYAETQYMAADICTKGFTDPNKWRHVCRLINIGEPEALFRFHVETLPLASSVLDARGGGRQPQLNEREARLRERVAYWTEPPHASDVPAGARDDLVCAPCAISVPENAIFHRSGPSFRPSLRESIRSRRSPLWLILGSISVAVRSGVSLMAWPMRSSTLWPISGGIASLVSIVALASVFSSSATCLRAILRGTRVPRLWRLRARADSLSVLTGSRVSASMTQVTHALLAAFSGRRAACVQVS
jgi:hypothetical protein